MFDLYKKLSEKYPNWRFGYKFDDEFVSISVSNKSFTYVKRMTMPADMKLQDYADAYVKLLKELTGENKEPQNGDKGAQEG